MLGPICCKSYNVNGDHQLLTFLLVQKKMYSLLPLNTRFLTSIPAEIWFFKSSDRGCRTKGPLPNLGRLTVYCKFFWPYWGISGLIDDSHEVLTYVEYRAVSGVFQNIDSPPPFNPVSVSSPRTKGGGVHYTHTRWAVRGVRGLIFWKTLDIGLALTV
jgi:hypothetical protein